jgi:hypothetical protein
MQELTLSSSSAFAIPDIFTAAKPPTPEAALTARRLSSHSWSREAAEAEEEAEEAEEAELGALPTSLSAA